jgi:hypothetical protein
MADQNRTPLFNDRSTNDADRHYFFHGPLSSACRAVGIHMSNKVPTMRAKVFLPQINIILQIDIFDFGLDAFKKVLLFEGRLFRIF